MVRRREGEKIEKCRNRVTAEKGDVEKERKKGEIGRKDKTKAGERRRVVRKKRQRKSGKVCWKNKG